MAEAFPDDHDLPDDSRKPISILLLATRWQFDTYGLSTVNKSLVNNLRLIDPDGKAIKITCAVLQDDGEIKDEDLKDARKERVDLKGAKRPRGSKRGTKPKLQWLDKSPGAYYFHLVQDQNYDFIVGHAPYVANGCFNLRDLHRNKQEPPKIILIFHELPTDENKDVDTEMLLDWLNESDVVFSIGQAIEDELLPYIKTLEPQKRPSHKLYLPSYPLDLFVLKQNKVESKIRGTQNVSIMSGDIKDLDVNGLDFPLAVTATAGASEHIREFDGVRINLTLLAAKEEEKVEWKQSFSQVVTKHNLDKTGLSFQTEAPITMDKMEVHMRKSNLFLLQLKHNSPFYGTEALAAIAAGVPVLVSRHSGLARFLHKIVGDESVVYETKSQSAKDMWQERILKRLLRPEESQGAAVRLREQLLQDTNIAQTHLDFINTIAGTCNKL